MVKKQNHVAINMPNISKTTAILVFDDYFSLSISVTQDDKKAIWSPGGGQNSL